MSVLTDIPVHKRRQLSATLGLFAVLMIAVGLVAATGPATTALMTFVVIALLVGVVLAVMSWGVALSIKGDLQQQRLDSAIADAIAEHSSAGGVASLSCGCGHEHDPEELHVTDDPCGHDGQGSLCSQTCDTCVLSRLKSTATAETVAPRPRPRPTPTR